MGASSAVPGTADRIVGPHPPRSKFVSPPAGRIQRIAGVACQTGLGALIETIPSLDFHAREMISTRSAWLRLQ